MAEIEIKGTITVNGVTTKFQVAGDNDTGVNWQQWSGTTEQLGERVDLLDAINNAAADLLSHYGSVYD